MKEAGPPAGLASCTALGISSSTEPSKALHASPAAVGGRACRLEAPPRGVRQAEVRRLRLKLYIWQEEVHGVKHCSGSKSGNRSGRGADAAAQAPLSRGQRGSMRTGCTDGASAWPSSLTLPRTPPDAAKAQPARGDQRLAARGGRHSALHAPICAGHAAPGPAACPCRRWACQRGRLNQRREGCPPALHMHVGVVDAPAHGRRRNAKEYSVASRSGAPLQEGRTGCPLHSNPHARLCAPRHHPPSLGVVLHIRGAHHRHPRVQVQLLAQVGAALRMSGCVGG
jgi:hypothetical protein